METATKTEGRAVPWNKGKLLGQKPPLKLKEIWAIRIVMQKKTQRPVQFEITEQTRDAVAAWIAAAHLKPEEFLFPSRMSASPHLSTRQYSRIVGSWVGSIGLDPAAYGTHSMRCTKPTLIYRRTRNLRAVQLLLGHTKLESTVRYLGIEVDDALEIADRIAATRPTQ